MGWVYLLIWGTWIVFGVSTVWALSWAARHSHLSDFDGAARSIFDKEEPVGQMTDYFPGQGPDRQPWLAGDGDD